ncbi:MAG: pseudouridine synthase [Bacillota bacterium]|uniref:pseudouridine synthase n=1 Tax=Desulfurispora thermophila TaxID=265470 RepID=UPI0003732C03|nr:pseudouridine synthase [Desulfurispora thermophila]
MERLQKFMARCGVASRRQCEQMIAAGLVKVNGQVVTKLGTRVKPGKDVVVVNGRLLRQPEKKVYYMVYKPRGYLSALSDPAGRKLVTDLLPGVKQRVYPVGRLDYDSEGLLILTNDGQLTRALTHPSSKVPKTYRVRVQGIPSWRALEQLAGGIQLEDGITAPATVGMIDVLNGNALLEITIHEGRNRQIRRMCEAIGHPVLRLKRIRFGPLQLGKMKAGEFRELKNNEVRALLASAKLL